jgi:N-acetylglucosamine-6-phosphate deacetylase
MVTLAPELRGGLDAVRRLAASGIVAAVGHTDATYDVARAALDAGASVGTHLFNAMRPLHHREPGPVAALLEHPDAHVELIADGVHVHPAALRLAAGAKPHRTILVTDAMAAAAAQDGDYRLGRMTVTVREGVARLREGGAIAGSTLTMAAAVRYAVQVAGLPIQDVVRAATSSPATLLALDRVGSLRPGFRADLVVLDEHLAVQRVLHRGRWVAR